MPMAATVLTPPLHDGDRLTRDEFLRRWDAMPDLKHAELIDGVVHMAYPVSTPHGDFHMALAAWIWNYAATTPGCAGGLDATWLMSDLDVPQPDTALRILPQYGGQSRLERNYAVGAPELIVEVSESSFVKDSGAKLRLYQRAGVREYIIARPGKRQVIWRELSEGAYREVAPEADGVVRSRVFPGMWLDTAANATGDWQDFIATAHRGRESAEHAAFVQKLAAGKR